MSASLSERREYHQRWREENRVKCRAAGRRYYAANRDKENERARGWRAENADKVRDNFRAWCAANPAEKLNKDHRRRARKADAPQGDQQEAAAYIEVLRGGICELCGAHGSLHIDHIEPLSTGGEHGWENFAGLCASCNTSKGAKPLLTHMLEGVS